MGLVESIEQIERKMLSSMRDQLNDKLRAAAPKIEQRLQKACFNAVVQSEVYKSLTEDGGQLRQELGIDNPNQMEVILDSWVTSINVTVEMVRATSSGLVGGLKVRGMGLSSFNDVQAIGVISTRRGEKIPWLEWLCLEGSRVIIRGYEVTAGNPYERYAVSRTHSLVMKKGKEGQEAKWSVPSWASGEKGNNFLTRALSTVDIAGIVEQELSR